METESVTITALTIVEQLTPMQLFAPEHLSPILERIKAEVRATPKDISTPEGVAALKHLVYKVVKTKTFIEAQRVALVADEKKRLASIDAEGRRAWKELEELQDSIYSSGFYYLSHTLPRMITIAVESKPPHETAVYSISVDIMRTGHQLVARWAEILTECEKAGTWPAAVEGIVPLNLPSWAVPDGDFGFDDLVAVDERERE
jgi:hypothetical protein